MKYNKIIFLDIDGVINIPPYKGFDSDCMDNLQVIINETGAKIVVSSSWRCDFDLMKEQLMKYGFTENLWKEIVGITCRGYKNVVKGSKLPIVRGNEIKHWVDTQMVYPWHGNPEMDELYKKFDEHGQFIMMDSNKVGRDFSYVILDDDDDMLLEQAKWFINTDWQKGLTDKDTLAAIALLNSIDAVHGSVANADDSSNVPDNQNKIKEN